MAVDFYQPLDPSQSTNPDYVRMAAMLMQQRQPGQVPQGQSASTTGSVLGSANQLAGAALAGMRANNQLDANKAATALNGGVATAGQIPNGFQRFGSWLNGLGGA